MGTKRELHLDAALRSHELVPFIDDHGLDVREAIGRILMREQERE
jgi:hypothetical protein